MCLFDFRTCPVDEYFEAINLPEDLWGLLAQVPPARVTTYGALAGELGDVAAARWVGEYLLSHPHAEGCPCHRVVRRTGELGLYITGNPQEKQDRLERDSVEVSHGRVDLQRFGFDDFSSRKPLAALSEFQEALPGSVSLKPFPETPELVAGVDVSYVGRNRAVGAYVVIDVAGGQLVWSTTVSKPVTFPYIPGYLAFREAPILLELLREVESRRQLADLVLVDGNGMLHHRHAGIATHVGVVADVPTVGIGKKLLCGRVDLNGIAAGEPRPVTHAGRVVGMAVKAKDTYRPIFVSPGQHIDVADAVRITQLLFHGHRLPEPIYQADRLSRRAAKET